MVMLCVAWCACACSVSAFGLCIPFILCVQIISFCRWHLFEIYFTLSRSFILIVNVFVWPRSKRYFARKGSHMVSCYTKSRKWTRRNTRWIQAHSYRGDSGGVCDGVGSSSSISLYASRFESPNNNALVWYWEKIIRVNNMWSVWLIHVQRIEFKKCHKSARISVRISTTRLDSIFTITHLNVHIWCGRVLCVAFQPTCQLSKPHASASNGWLDAILKHEHPYKLFIISYYYYYYRVERKMRLFHSLTHSRRSHSFIHSFIYSFIWKSTHTRPIQSIYSQVVNRRCFCCRLRPFTALATMYHEPVIDRNFYKKREDRRKKVPEIFGMLDNCFV